MKNSAHNHPLTRRSVLGFSAAAFGAVTLSGCAGVGGGKAQGGDAQNLQFWSNHPGTSKSLEEQLIKNFQAENSSIKITLIDGGKTYPEVAQKFNAALSGGQLPDIVIVSDTTWFNFAANGQIAPLEDLYSKAGVDPSDYVKPLYADYTFKDKHYALPYSRSTPLFYYNEELWQQAGLPARGPKDWMELQQWAAILKEKTSVKTPLMTFDGANYADWIFQGAVWSMGGSFSKEWTATFTDPNTIKMAELWQKMKKDGQFDVTEDPTPLLASGQVACTLQSTGDLKGILEGSKGKAKISTAFLPGPKGQSCPTGGAGLAIPAGISEERKINALKAISFLTNPQSTSIFSQGTGYMPVRVSAQNTPTIKKYLAEVPQAKTALEQLPYTRPQDAARVFVAGGGQQIGGALDKILQGADVTGVMKDLQSWTQPKLDELGKKAK